MSNKRYKWIIFSLGIIIGLFVSFFLIPGGIKELSRPQEEFPDSMSKYQIFLSKIFFIILPLWTIAPYFIAGFIANKISYPWVMLITSILLFSFSLWATIQIFYFPQSSTAVLGLLILPFWGILLIFIVWAIYGIIRLISRRFST